MQEPSSYRRLLANNRDFRRLWLGDLSSFLGDWFNLIALYATVQAITSSATAVALVMVVKTLPSFLIAPIAGPIIDRYDRRRLLLAMDFIRAGCVVGLIIASWLSSLFALYGFTFAMVLCTGVAFPTKKAVLPTLVEGKDLGVANALSGGTWSIMLAVGAALGGLATEFLGVTAALTIDALTYLVSAWLFSGLPRLLPAGRKDRKSTTFVEGLRYLRRTPYILAVVFLKPFMAFANGAMVLIPIYGTIAFGAHRGALFIGLLYAARGLGATFGSFVIRAVIGDSPRALRRWMVFAYVLMAGSLLFVAQADHFWQAALGFFGAAVGSASIWVFSGTLLQMEGDGAYHGRIFAVEFGLTTLILAGSSFTIGMIMDFGMSLGDVTYIAAMLPLSPALFWFATLVWLRRQSRSDAQGGDVGQVEGAAEGVAEAAGH